MIKIVLETDTKYTFQCCAVTLLKKDREVVLGTVQPYFGVSHHLRHVMQLLPSQTNSSFFFFPPVKAFCPPCIFNFLPLQSLYTLLLPPLNLFFYSSVLPFGACHSKLNASFPPTIPGFLLPPPFLLPPFFSYSSNNPPPPPSPSSP